MFAEMCGIFGVFQPRGATPIGADIDAALSLMLHRGPDGEGRWSSADGRYQVGFRRLAIIDLETGDQPIHDHAERFVLVGNGEIYNYRELRQRAEAANYPFRSQGDMESILPLAAAMGDAFVHELNGMYGLALYDRRAHSLLLVRDRLGVKPLYWCKLSSGGIAYASEIKALFAAGLISPAIDEAAVSAYLAHGYVPSPATLFRGVYKLPAGHLLRVDAAGTIQEERYWRAVPAGDLPADETDIAEHLTTLLRDSMRLQLRSDVPVGALLSGGIDSGLMVALASEFSSRPLRTFTVRFGGAAIDEAPLAAMVAERYGTDHTVMDLPAASVADYLPGIAWHAEEPLNDAALLPNLLVERELGQHVKVALNGTGGDELFAGYGRYFQLPVEARYLSLPAWLRRGLVEPLADAADPMTAWRLRRAAKFSADRGSYLHDHCTHFPLPIRRMIGNSMPLPDTAQGQAFAEFDGPAQSGALYADMMTYVPEDLLTLLDRTSMAASVEGRVPFLDHRLVEAALAVPPHVRTPGGQQKGLERRMAQGLLPEAVINAPKQGFASPVPSWMKSGLGALARQVLTQPHTLDRGWWTADGIEKLVSQPDRHGFRLYSLLMLELAVRLHVEGGRGLPDHHAPLEAFADAA